MKVYARRYHPKSKLQHAGHTLLFAPNTYGILFGSGRSISRHVRTDRLREKELLVISLHPIVRCCLGYKWQRIKLRHTA